MRPSTICLSNGEISGGNDNTYPLLTDHVRLLYDAGDRSSGSGVGDADFDIVLVHGLGSEELSCWVNERGLLWPAVFLPQDFPRCRILAAGYSHALWRWAQDRFAAGAVATLRGAIGAPTPTSAPTSSSTSSSSATVTATATATASAAAALKEEPDMDLRRCAADLAARLLSDAVGVGQRPVFFVAHSLGGLVVKQMIVCEGDSALLRSLRGCVFYATPHFGASIARMVVDLRRVSEALSGVAPSDVLAALGDHNREGLTALNTEFLRVGAAVLSFAETRRVNGVVRVVDAESANPAPNDSRCAFYTVDADHFGIHRPISKAQTSYAALAAFIERMQRETAGSTCGNAQKGELLELHALVTEVRQFIDMLREALAGRHTAAAAATAPVELIEGLVALCDEMVQSAEHHIAGMKPTDPNLKIELEVPLRLAAHWAARVASDYDSAVGAGLAALRSEWETASGHFDHSATLAVTHAMGDEWGNFTSLIFRSDSVMPMTRRLLLRAALCTVRRRETFEELIAHTDTIASEPRTAAPRDMKPHEKPDEATLTITLNPEALALAAHAGICLCLREELSTPPHQLCRCLLQGRRRRDALKRALGIESPGGCPFAQQSVTCAGGLCGAALRLWRGIESRAAADGWDGAAERRSGSSRSSSGSGTVRMWRDGLLVCPVQLRRACSVLQATPAMAEVQRWSRSARGTGTQSMAVRVDNKENACGWWGVATYAPNAVYQTKCCVGLVKLLRRDALALRRICRIVYRFN